MNARFRTRDRFDRSWVFQNRANRFDYVFHDRFQQTSVESIRNLGQIAFQPFVSIIGSSRPRKTRSLFWGGVRDRLRWLQTLTPFSHGCGYGQISIRQLVALAICSSLLPHGNLENAVTGEAGTNSPQNMTERMFAEETLFGGDSLGHYIAIISPYTDDPGSPWTSMDVKRFLDLRRSLSISMPVVEISGSS